MFSWTDASIDVLLVLFVLVCVLMCLVVLMQRSKQEGLGAAFGGGFTDSVFGAQTSNVLVKTTVYLAISFFIISILLARLYTHRAELNSHGTAAHQMLLHPTAAPTATPSTAPATPAAPVVPTATPMTATPPPATTNAPAAAVPPAPAK